jgi:hypothetical protein
MRAVAFPCSKNLRDTTEYERLTEPSTFPVKPWRRWGPYVSERGWGTVREDYSADGDAWNYFPHHLARSKAYRWGEDGLAAICDRYQLLVFALALWNGRDPILKERLYGVIPGEGNHGEDVKEYYFYLDSTPTHSYMRYLYKYPQSAFPYARLVEENRRRSVREPEFELLDTGVFDEDRYFDVFVEYAKAGPEDICVKIEAFNRGPDPAPLHIVPHLWFRNTWAWGATPKPTPHVSLRNVEDGSILLVADDSGAEQLRNLPFDYALGPRYLHASGDGEALFADNETNAGRVWGDPRWSRSQFTKDAFHRYIVGFERDAVNPAKFGTKACVDYSFPLVPPGASVTVRLRLSDRPEPGGLDEVERIVAHRRAEADEFYEAIHPPRATQDERLVQRQALAGMLWTKQVYLFDVNQWLEGDNPHAPPPASRKHIRNVHWRHLNSMRVLSMPDKWEYPWFAAWDLAFHCIPLALVDPEFAKEQLWYLLFEQFQHPNGQIPAYEWEFSDLNPPVHAWAVFTVFHLERTHWGREDFAWLESCYHKLLLNFTWWINKVDREGNNIFEGGFLGLDNITVFDRSQKLEDGSALEQSDATGWMGMFCQNLMRIALELAKKNKVYESLATKFFQHYVYVGAAMKHMGNRDFQLWDEDEGFFYDVLRHPRGGFSKLRVRSLVGLIPLYAVERLEDDWLAPFPLFRSNLQWFMRNRQDLVSRCVVPYDRDGERTHVLTIVDQDQLRRVLERVWDTREFRSEFGLRSLSKFHLEHPFEFRGLEVRYEPAEATVLLKGGNSNWRGPIWFPTTFMLIESLRKLKKAYGGSYVILGGDGAGPPVTLDHLAETLADSLIAIFTRGADGRRPVHGRSRKFHEDPHWRDLVLFYEYFDGDTGAGLGASHQTGWTGLVAALIDEWRR